MHMLLTKLYETDIGSHSWSNVYYVKTLQFTIIALRRRSHI